MSQRVPCKAPLSPISRAPACLQAEDLIRQYLLPPEWAGGTIDSASSPAQELSGYLVDSFGNCTRIDYGTGHETTFAALLMCLAKLGILYEADCQALVTRVFVAYLGLMRKLQTTYW